MFEIVLTEEAEQEYQIIKSGVSQLKRYKAVNKSIQFLAQNPHHNSLQTHEYHTLKGPHGEKVFEAYAEQNTSTAYRIFWYYGPDKGVITIVAITPHP